MGMGGMGMDSTEVVEKRGLFGDRTEVVQQNDMGMQPITTTRT